MKKIIFLFIVFTHIILLAQETEIVLPINTILKDAPDITSNIVEVLKEEKNATVIDKAADNFWKVEINQRTFFVREPFILERNKNTFPKFMLTFAKTQDSIRAFNINQRYISIKNNIDLTMKVSNVKDLVKNFFKVPLKDEFETTEKFKNRMQYDSTKIHLFDINLFGYEDFMYNADANEFSFNPDKIIIGDLSIRKTKSFIGSNSFGKKMKVDVYEKTFYFVNPKNSLYSFYNSKGKLLYNRMRIPCSIDEAKKAKYFLVGRIGMTFKSYEDRDILEEAKTATIIDPTEVYTKTYYVRGSIQFIVFYNKITRKIYEIYFP